MTWREVFVSDRQLRPIWRCLLSVALIVAAYLLVVVVMGFTSHFLMGRARLFGGFTGSSVLMLPALLGVFKFMTGVFDRRPLGSVGLAFHPRWRAELGRGLVVGAVMILAVGGAEWLLGMARFSLSTESPAQIAGSGLFLGLLLLIAAANEELAFRGYPFQRLMDSIGPVGAIAAFSILFGLGHIANPNHTVVSTLNTMLVGVPLAVAYLRTRALWLAGAIDLGRTPLGLHGLSLGVRGALPATDTDLRVSSGGFNLIKATDHREIDAMVGALWASKR